MPDVYNLHAAKTHLSRLVDKAASGEEIIIARSGKPVARLVCLEAPPVDRKPGLLKGAVSIASDFDSPLPAELLDAFYSSGIDPVNE